MRNAVLHKNDASKATPGAVLSRMLQTSKISQARLAQALGLSRPRVNQILNGRCVITPAVALKLGRVLNTEPGFWLQLQNQRDLRLEQERLRDELAALPRLVQFKAG